ncbi:MULTISPECIES: hypothetical protein [unclassified Pseudomonas]|uniref:hypothetical protein n=1 Tax=unclassified Pseudomonas TaxID=196821 RepID=UPI001F5B8A05|nr:MULTISPECIES: hypothetical protein [unclassified Pseudomonas]
MTWYKTGTVSVTQGSNAVIGAGTSFIANSRVGDAFRGPDGEWYEVTNIASDIALSIAPSYQGEPVSGGVYSLAPMQGYVKDSADALRAATSVIASGVADMQEQVTAATEAAATAAQAKDVAVAKADIATAAADLSTQNKESTSQDATSAGQAALRAEAARDAVVGSEEAAAASAQAAAESAEEAEIVTRGKAASGANSDITSLSGLTTALSVEQGGTGSTTGVPTLVGATASTAGAKGLVPAPVAGDQAKFLAGDGTYRAVAAGVAWGGIAGSLADQLDLKAALDLKLNTSAFGATIVYPNGGTEAAPALAQVNSRYLVANPYPGFFVACYAQIRISGNWGNPEFVGTGTGSSIGVRANLFGANIVVQTGTGFIGTSSNQTGDPFGISGANTVPSPIRVIVVKTGLAL